MAAVGDEVIRTTIHSGELLELAEYVSLFPQLIPCLGFSHSTGQALAKAGYVSVIPSYRLSKVGIVPTLLLALAYSVVLSLVAFVVLLLPLSFLLNVELSTAVTLLLSILFVGFSTWLYWLEETGGNARHPQHAEDVAATIKWTMEHAHEYGGDKSTIFLAGHSAGAHLVSLVTLDRRYIRQQGLHEFDFDRCVKGVIAVSGVLILRSVSR
jgi:hypothetical protein